MFSLDISADKSHEESMKVAELIYNKITGGTAEIPPPKDPPISSVADKASVSRWRARPDSAKPEDPRTAVADAMRLFRTAAVDVPNPTNLLRVTDYTANAMGLQEVAAFQMMNSYFGAFTFTRRVNEWSAGARLLMHLIAKAFTTKGMEHKDKTIRGSEGAGAGAFLKGKGKGSPHFGVQVGRKALKTVGSGFYTADQKDTEIYETNFNITPAYLAMLVRLGRKKKPVFDEYGNILTESTDGQIQWKCEHVKEEVSSTEHTSRKNALRSMTSRVDPAAGGSGAVADPMEKTDAGEDAIESLKLLYDQVHGANRGGTEDYEKERNAVIHDILSKQPDWWPHSRPWDPAALYSVTHKQPDGNYVPYTVKAKLINGELCPIIADLDVYALCLDVNMGSEKIALLKKLARVTPEAEAADRALGERYFTELIDLSKHPRHPGNPITGYATRAEADYLAAYNNLVIFLKNRERELKGIPKPEGYDAASSLTCQHGTQQASPVDLPFDVNSTMLDWRGDFANLHSLAGFVDVYKKIAIAARASGAKVTLPYNTLLDPKIKDEIKKIGEEYSDAIILLEQDGKALYEAAHAEKMVASAPSLSVSPAEPASDDATGVRTSIPLLPLAKPGYFADIDAEATNVTSGRASGDGSGRTSGDGSARSSSAALPAAAAASRLPEAQGRARQPAARVEPSKLLPPVEKSVLRPHVFDPAAASGLAPAVTSDHSRRLTALAHTIPRPPAPPLNSPSHSTSSTTSLELRSGAGLSQTAGHARGSVHLAPVRARAGAISSLAITSLELRPDAGDLSQTAGAFHASMRGTLAPVRAAGVRSSLR